MRIEPLGDAAYIVRDLGESPAYRVAESLSRLVVPGIREVNAAYTTIGVYVDPEEFSLDALRAALDQSTTYEHSTEARRHSIPVCYELGEDLGSSASELGVSVSELVEAHTSMDYLCYAVGFAPGFAYLGRLPERISGLARMASPRLRVPAGAVAIANDLTGVYPGGRPGGWRIIGMTPLTIVDMKDDYFPIAAGDRVRFCSVTNEEFEERKGQRL